MTEDAASVGSSFANTIPPATRAERSRLWLYLLPVVTFPLLMLACAISVIPTRWFELRSGNTYMANLGYGATLFHRDCKVLIFGDSSAMVGLDPAVIQRQTGLTTCNIAEFEGVTLVSHTLLIDRFLENNPRPRFVVFLYTPEDLSITNDWASFNVGTFEAVTLQLQQARNLNTALQLALHPSVTLGWAELGLRMLIIQAHSAPVSFAAAHIRETTNGQLPISGNAGAKCDDGLRNRLPDSVWIDGLRKRYSTNGTRVIVDATPTVDCDRSLAFYQQHLNGLIDNTPYEPIPISSFSNDGRLHANQQGSQLLSTMVANQIIAQLNLAPRAMVANGIGDR
jgi:hypothetical protein